MLEMYQFFNDPTTLILIGCFRALAFLLLLYILFGFFYFYPQYKHKKQNDGER